MISIHIVLILLTLHFFSDFVLQTEYVSREHDFNKRVLVHTLLYAIPFLWFGIYWFGIAYVALNIFLHYVTDFITSNISKYYLNKNDKLGYFSILGLDQLIHTVTLIGTYYIMFVK